MKQKLDMVIWTLLDRYLSRADLCCGYKMMQLGHKKRDSTMSNHATKVVKIMFLASLGLILPTIALTQRLFHSW